MSTSISQPAGTRSKVSSGTNSSPQFNNGGSAPAKKSQLGYGFHPGFHQGYYPRGPPLSIHSHGPPVSTHSHSPPEAIHRPLQGSNASSMSPVFIPQPDRVSALEQHSQQLANQVQQSNTDILQKNKELEYKCLAHGYVDTHCLAQCKHVKTAAAELGWESEWTAAVAVFALAYKKKQAAEAAGTATNSNASISPYPSFKTKFDVIQEYKSSPPIARQVQHPTHPLQSLLDCNAKHPLNSVAHGDLMRPAVNTNEQTPNINTVNQDVSNRENVGTTILSKLTPLPIANPLDTLSPKLTRKWMFRAPNPNETTFSKSLRQREPPSSNNRRKKLPRLS